MNDFTYRVIILEDPIPDARRRTPAFNEAKHHKRFPRTKMCLGSTPYIRKCSSSKNEDDQPNKWTFRRWFFHIFQCSHKSLFLVPLKIWLDIAWKQFDSLARYYQEAADTKWMSEMSRLFPGPLPDFFVLAGMQHDFVRESRSHTRMTFGPIVRNSVRENVPRSIECGARDWSWCGIETWITSMSVMQHET